MLKLKNHNKFIEKAVGADDPVRPLFEEHTPNKKSSKARSNLISNLQPLTSKTGITLIALIITIIVMLILVGVTINVALNGGLFGKAKTAVTQTQKEIDREQLLSEVVSAMDNNGQVDFEQLKTNLEKLGWTVVLSGDKATCTSPKGNNTFTVNKKGEITEDEINSGEDDDPSTFKWSDVNLNIEANTEYASSDSIALDFLADGKVVILSEDDILATIDATNSENIDEQTGNLNFNVEETDVTISMAENESDVNLIIKVEEEDQSIQFKKTTGKVYSNEEVLKKLGIENSTGTYNGTWKEIGTESGKTKLVSTISVASCTLGYEDPRAIEAVPAGDASDMASVEYDRSIWSYNNVVNTLNDVSKEATGISYARSVTIEDIYDALGGEENIDKGLHYGKIFKFFYDINELDSTGHVYSKYKIGTDEDSWSENFNTRYDKQTFINESGEKVVVDSEGDEIILTNTMYNYSLSPEQKLELGSILPSWRGFLLVSFLWRTRGARIFSCWL